MRSAEGTQDSSGLAGRLLAARGVCLACVLHLVGGGHSAVCGLALESRHYRDFLEVSQLFRHLGSGCFSLLDRIRTESWSTQSLAFLRAKKRDLLLIRAWCLGSGCDIGFSGRFFVCPLIPSPSSSQCP